MAKQYAKQSTAIGSCFMSQRIRVKSKRLIEKEALMATKAVKPLGKMKRKLTHRYELRKWLLAKWKKFLDRFDKNPKARPFVSDKPIRDKPIKNDGIKRINGMVLTSKGWVKE